MNPLLLLAIKYQHIEILLSMLIFWDNDRSRCNHPFNSILIQDKVLASLSRFFKLFNILNILFFCIRKIQDRISVDVLNYNSTHRAIMPDFEAVLLFGLNLLVTQFSIFLILPSVF